MNRVSIKISITDAQLRKTVVQTLKVETEASATTRSSVEIDEDGEYLVIEISATDLVATRAITNSILRLLKTSVDVVGSISF